MPMPMARQFADHRDSSQMQAFAQAQLIATGDDARDYANLHAWSVTHFRDFWHGFVDWCGPSLRLQGEPEPVCEGDECEHARFFPRLRLNYADSLLNEVIAPPDAPALTQCHADGSRTRWSRGELRERVARLADALAAQGIGDGDRVVAVMRNDGQAVLVALAVTALGASLSTAAPDMGTEAIVERFAPLAPRLLIAHTLAQPFDAGLPLVQKVESLVQALPSLDALMLLDGAWTAAAPRQVHTLEALLDAGDASRFEWRAFGFNHPLFILFSSGTTGKPKCIVHGAGGTLLEHVKEHRLHTDLRPGDRMYFHTSCGWMMWNWQLSALASGVEIVTYDGPVSSVERLWELVAQERVEVFGTSPAYLRMCEVAGLSPRERFDLSALRQVLSTGAVLHDAQFRWIAAQVGELPVQSISGGTDILGCFVLGHPDLAVECGLAQCRSLGLDVQAWQGGAPVAPGQIGELVCRNPFPSRPLGFFGDTDGERFHAAYFKQNPGVWTHGDLIEFSPAGGARMHGRSDGLLNVRGMKFAPIEVLRVIEAFAEVQSALVVEQHSADAAQTAIVGLLVMRPGAALDTPLVGRMRREIGQRLSLAHVPDRLLAVADLPITHSGKLSEAAARAAISGQDVGNASALRNPQCLAQLRAAAAPVAMPGAEPGPPQSLEQLLCAIWQRHLSAPAVTPQDNYFDLGGNSLRAALVLADVARLTGRALPLATLAQAPTVGQLAALIERGDAVEASPAVVSMRAGVGRPLLLLPGLGGTVMECWRLIRALRTTRPVIGLQARGMDGEQAPHDNVADMADFYTAAIRGVQPHGPYALCGYSFGGLVALEIARRLAQDGESLELVCLLDSQLHLTPPAPQRAWQRAGRIATRLARVGAPEWRRGLTVLRDRLRGAAQPPAFAASPDWPAAQQRVYRASLCALAAYRPTPYDGGRVLYVRSRIPLRGYLDPLPAWRDAARAGLDVVDVPGEHLELMERQATNVAAAIDAMLQADAASPVGYSSTDACPIPSKSARTRSPGAADNRPHQLPVVTTVPGGTRAP